MPPTEDLASIDLDWAGRPVRVEYQWLRPGRADRPLVVFLHEGLGSIAMWRDFPRAFCEAADVRGLVWSRPGYGRSTPRAHGERWAPDYLHRQAREVLPALLRALGVETPVWLFGHSDGGSIALVFAASFPRATAGLVVAAPHIFVEEKALAGIRVTLDAFATAPMRERLARYHDDVDSAFHGWADAWLDPPFATAFDLRALLPAVDCPLLAVQGVDDEYATLEQIRGIARRVPQTVLLELADCGHSPHRDQPARLIAEAARFVQASESSAPG